MINVITYGTFDLLHMGHIELLKRAKGLGDKLIVCLSTDDFNLHMKGKRCIQSYDERKLILESLRYVDLVVPEKTWEQKSTDIDKYSIDIFVIGDDWNGKFDYLKEKCKVLYLPRTPNISTSARKGTIRKELF